VRAYPASLESQPEGGFTVTFRDVPEAITQGDTLEEALREAVDALVTALDFYVGDRLPLPAASPMAEGEHLVEVTPLAEAKLGLYETMGTAGVGKAELARRLGVHLMQVDRMLSLLHASKLEQIERGLHALGMRIDLIVRAA
jgi:antitoxin HicB